MIIRKIVEETVIDKDAPETLELYAKWEKKIESQVKKR